MDVAVWLRSLGLEQYEAAFRENAINEKVLPSLTQEDLKEIGVGPVGHRRMLLEAIAVLRTDVSGNAPSTDAATASSAPSVSSEDRAERRQVTVMFSDLVGSTALDVARRLRFVDHKVACDDPFGDHWVFGKEFSEFADGAHAKRRNQAVD